MRGLAVFLAVLSIGLSAGLAGRLGWVSAGSEAEGVVFAFGCVLLDAWKSVIPLLVAEGWKRGRRVVPGFLSVVMLGLMALSMVSAIGFSEANRGAVAGSGSEAVRRAASLHEEAARLRSHIASRSDARAIGEVEALMASIRRQSVVISGDARTLSVVSKECTRLTKDTEEGCRALAAAETELARARERARLSDELRDVERALREFSGLAHGGVADPSVTGIAKLSGVEAGVVRTVASIVFAVLLEIMSSFGLYFASLLKREKPVIARANLPVAGETDEALVERFFAERVELMRGSVVAGELHRHYCAFVVDRGGYPLSVTAFGNVVAKRGIEKVRVSGLVRYQGIGIKGVEVGVAASNEKSE